MSTLFDRKVVLSFGPPGQEDAGRRLEGLHIGFRVTMPDSSEPNRAMIEVFNPSPESIGLALEPHTVFRLFVGYRGYGGEQGVEKQVFMGVAVQNGVTVRKEGPTRVLSIEALDGGQEYAYGRLNASWSTEATVSQVLDKVLEGIALPRGLVEIPQPGARWVQGAVFRGPARSMLDRIAASQGCRWFIRDGAFYMVPFGKSTGETAPVYSVSKRNLIGSPTPRDRGIRIKVLLDAGMRPGRRFVLESERYNGIYLATDVEFQGDSGFSGAFYTEINGIPYTDPPAVQTAYLGGEPEEPWWNEEMYVDTYGVLQRARDTLNDLSRGNG